MGGDIILGVLRFIITLLAAFGVVQVFIGLSDEGLAHGNNWHCTASERINTEEPPEFKCTEYTLEKES
jgi:hypothetical protein